MAKTPASKKAKGSRYERYLADRISDVLKDYGIWAKRTPMSGAIEGWKGDLTCNIPICIEAKCQESLNFRKAFRQAEDAATPRQIPVMVTSRNNDPQSLAMLDFEDLLTLLEYAIQGGWGK